MRKGTWTSKNGTVNSGILTSTRVPNNKPKRVRKSAYQQVGNTITTEITKVNITGAGIAGAILTAGFAPLDIGWKIC